MDLRHRLKLTSCAAMLTVIALAHKPVSASPAARPTRDKASRVFCNVKVCDFNIADELKPGAQQVGVNCGGLTQLNAFPPRMNTWLAAVKHSGGTVSSADPGIPVLFTRRPDAQAGTRE